MKERSKPKFLITTTVPQTLFFFSGQCKKLKDKYEVCAVSTPNDRLTEFGYQEGIRVKGLSMKRDISIVNDLSSLVRWIILLLSERPKLVHGNTPKASLLSMVAAWIVRVPVRIYMCHGLRYQGCVGKKRKLLMLMERISCKCATHVICVSKGVQDTLVQDNICCKNKSIVIKYGSANGVDTRHFSPEKTDCSEIKSTYCLHPSDFVVCFIGRLVRDKGIEELVKSAIKLKEKEMPIKFLLIGRRESTIDSLSTEVEHLIDSSDFIIETGLQRDIRPYLKASNLLVLPSYREGFGQVLIEAGAMGVPVIASNIIGCNNVVEIGENGILCEAKSVDSLFEAINKLYKDKDLYGSIKSRCRDFTIERYDRNSLQNEYVSYYTSLLTN